MVQQGHQVIQGRAALKYSTVNEGSETGTHMLQDEAWFQERSHMLFVAYMKLLYGSDVQRTYD